MFPLYNLTFMRSISPLLFTFLVLINTGQLTQIELCFANNQLALPPVYHLLRNSCDQNTYPLKYGRWGKPDEVLELPSKEAGEGVYYKDIQASFPDVDWQKVDRLYIPAGSYKFIYLGNLPEREAHDPLIITNHGGQVRVGGYDHYYLFVIQGGKNWVLTGRYDPLSKTGDEQFRGHWCGEYANSRDTYGFLIDDQFVRNSVSGLGIGGRATDFEVEFIEIRQVGFAGMTIKTDNDGTATMSNISIHDTYIHDTLSEGYYIGSTQSQPQHQVKNLELYNNRVIRSGTEAIQVGQLGGNVHIHNNVFALSALHWKNAFQQWQDGNLQISNRTGNLTIEDNIFIGAAGNIAFSSGLKVAGDNYPASSTILFSNNYFSSSRNLFFYLRNDQFPGLEYRFTGNYFTHWDFQRGQIDPTAREPREMIRTYTPAPVSFTHNTWNVDLDFSNQLSSGNGTRNNYSGSGNIKAAPPSLFFIDNGLDDDFDYLKVEVWSATAGLGGDRPISYEFNDIAMHKGVPYRCLLTLCPAGWVPPENPMMWERLPYFADDWRLRDGASLPHLGLLY